MMCTARAAAVCTCLPCTAAANPPSLTSRLMSGSYGSSKGISAASACPQAAQQVLGPSGICQSGLSDTALYRRQESD